MAKHTFFFNNFQKNKLMELIILHVQKINWWHNWKMLTFMHISSSNSIWHLPTCASFTGIGLHLPNFQAKIITVNYFSDIQCNKVTWSDLFVWTTDAWKLPCVQMQLKTVWCLGGLGLNSGSDIKYQTLYILQMLS